MGDFRSVVSRRDEAVLFELVYACLSSGKKEELKDLVKRLGTLFPYEHAIFSFARTHGFPAPSHTIINLSYPSEWVDLYVKERFDMFDPTAKEFRLRPGLQFWSDSLRKHGDGEAVVKRATDFGLREGYTFGARSYHGDQSSLFSFSTKASKREPRTEFILASVIPHFHQALERILRTSNPRETSDIQLSHREIEVLKWTKAGKTRWEISVILSISDETVKWYMANILKKLKATNKAQAIAIALEKGLISVG